MGEETESFWVKEFKRTEVLVDVAHLFERDAEVLDLRELWTTLVTRHVIRDNCQLVFEMVKHMMDVRPRDREFFAGLAKGLLIEMDKGGCKDAIKDFVQRAVVLFRTKRMVAYDCLLLKMMKRYLKEEHFMKIAEAQCSMDPPNWAFLCYFAKKLKKEAKDWTEEQVERMTDDDCESLGFDKDEMDMRPECGHPLWVKAIADDDVAYLERCHLGNENVPFDARSLDVEVSGGDALGTAVFYGAWKCIDYLMKRCGGKPSDYPVQMMARYDVNMIREYRPDWQKDEVLEAVCRYDRYCCVLAYYRNDDTKKIFRQCYRYDSFRTIEELSSFPDFRAVQYEFVEGLTEELATGIVPRFLNEINVWFKRAMDDLRQLCTVDEYYDDAEELIQKIRGAACYAGFRAYIKRGAAGMYCKLYCEYGCLQSKASQEKKTRKCDCPFFVNIGLTKKGYHITSYNLRHAIHEFSQGTAILNSIPSDLWNFISDMVASKISPKSIARALRLSTGHDFTPEEVQRNFRGMYHDKRTEIVDDLVRATVFPGGMAQELFVGPLRQAVLSVRVEQKPLLEFADVIFLDATKVATKLGWSMIPLIVVNSDMRLRCMGVAFTAYETSNFYEWLFYELGRIDEISKLLRTVVTDEDSALVNSMPKVQERWESNFGRRIEHVICAWHKSVSFGKRLVSLDKRMRDQLSAAWARMCYARSRRISDMALAEMKELVPADSALMKYILECVEPMLDRFAVSHLSHVFTAGYNTSSLSESSNSRYKRALTGGNHTLTEISDIIVEVDAAADKRQREEDLLSGGKESVSRDVFGIEARSAIQKRLDRSITKALGMRVTVGEQGDFLVTDPLHARDIYIVQEDVCSCHYCEMAGLPCAHLIAVYMIRHMEDGLLPPFPYTMMHSRYRWELRSQNGERISELGRQIGKEEGVRGRELEGSSEEEDDRERQGPTSSSQRFQSLKRIIMPIISQASENGETAARLEEALRGLAEGFGREGVRDVVVTQGKGRPKNRRIRRPGEHG